MPTPSGRISARPRTRARDAGALQAERERQPADAGADDEHVHASDRARACMRLASPLASASPRRAPPGLPARLLQRARAAPCTRRVRRAAWRGRPRARRGSVAAPARVAERRIGRAAADARRRHGLVAGGGRRALACAKRRCSRRARAAERCKADPALSRQPPAIVRPVAVDRRPCGSPRARRRAATSRCGGGSLDRRGIAGRFALAQLQLQPGEQRPAPALRRGVAARAARSGRPLCSDAAAPQRGADQFRAREVRMPGARPAAASGRCGSGSSGRPRRRRVRRGTRIGALGGSGIGRERVVSRRTVRRTRLATRPRSAPAPRGASSAGLPVRAIAARASAVLLRFDARVAGEIGRDRAIQRRLRVHCQSGGGGRSAHAASTATPRPASAGGRTARRARRDGPWPSALTAA